MLTLTTASMLWGPINLEDLKNFPQYDRELTLKNYRLALDHVEFMRGRVLSCWPTDQVYCDLWLSEAIWCKDVWDKFDDAVLYCGESSNNPEAAEYSLGRLRLLLGPEAYYRGILPPVYPTWMYPKP